MSDWLSALLPALIPASLVVGSWAYCFLLVAGARRYRSVRPPAPGQLEPISVLKPLHGLDEGLEQNLRTFFEQDYPAFELLFAARDEDDPGLALARRLAREYPHIPASFLLTGDPRWPNAKAWSLGLMMRQARYDLLVMSDSDIRVTPEMLRTIAAEFSDPRLGVATCPYRAVPGLSFWSTLEAIGMNTEFWGGALTARLVERGVHFAVGPTLAARRKVVESVGGWDCLSGYLAEDFVLGRRAAEAGYGVILSSYVIEHRIGSQRFLANLAHRLRWNRSTRRSRPAGYLGQGFTNPLPLALMLVAVEPRAWPVLIGTALLRAWTAFEVAVLTLKDRPRLRLWALLPLQDLLSFALWIAGFFGNKIRWRGRRYRLLPDGRFELLRP
jgi:ceramide glucosyltransferase